ncbi:MAG: hypothetical protein IJB75_05480 [Oscillospiraceae bacterium]|nr:hypothetical protein [Oscillospiraceae bacterium]
MEKDKLRAKQLFAAMSKKEKIRHIATYYWPHILGVVLAVAAVVSIGLTMRDNAIRSNWLHVGVVAPYAELVQPQMELLGEQAGEPLNYLELMSLEGEYGTDAMTQLSCYLAADQLDVVVSDAVMLEYLQVQDGEENLGVYPMGQTTLVRSFEGYELPELYLVVRRNVTRSDRAEAFARLLVTEPTP